LREAIIHFLNEYEQLKYSLPEILVSCGGRPLIYSVYRAICDKGDKVIYAVPSWNNNHYTHFVEGEHIVIEAGPETNFMPSVEQLRPHINGATLLSLCSPQNPTGTTFTKEELEAICDMVIDENKRRGDGKKKLYVMYDQMYWHLTYGKIEHYNPVGLRPEMKHYTVFIDAISKVFAATGVRVGWAMGPAEIINKMKAILGHVGAWAPMAEQKAVARYLYQKDKIDQYLITFKSKIEERLWGIHDGLIALKKKGYNVDAIAPQAAIYLTVKFDLVGKTTENGTLLENQADVTAYLLNEARLAIVPLLCIWYGPHLAVGIV
jgi:aspartate aminotransferase